MFSAAGLPAAGLPAGGSPGGGFHGGGFHRGGFHGGGLPGGGLPGGGLPRRRASRRRASRRRASTAAGFHGGGLPRRRRCLPLRGKVRAAPPKPPSKCWTFYRFHIVSIVLFIPPILRLATASHVRRPQMCSRPKYPIKNTGGSAIRVMGISGFRVPGGSGFGLTGRRALGRRALGRAACPCGASSAQTTDKALRSDTSAGVKC